ncbi:NAD(P)H-binding protein [Hamadaea tsunoensis]|uniref:NAD(P)H-binding protein n=1 Tax=Hamadaea tsunoensis TaxID=53368 RepID=UPI0004159357|nr:NAD(P)H-binding protein [Hamadaea tsunoensis]
MITIIGATGTIGRLTLSALLDQGVRVAAVTRDPHSELPAGAYRIVGDPGRPETLAGAIDGTQALLISPRAVGPALADLLELARRGGTRQAVLLSAATVAYPAGLAKFRAGFEAAELATAESGLEWTFLRSTDYAANALAWAGQVRAGDVVRGAYAAARTSTVHERDVAAVAARALTEPGHAGKSYILTGPESLSQADKVRLLGAATGRPLTFQELPPDDVRAGMLAAGLPEEVPDRLLGSLADYAREPGPTSDDVEKVLGRPALTFADWAAEHAAAFTGGAAFASGAAFTSGGAR